MIQTINGDMMRGRYLFFLFLMISLFGFISYRLFEMMIINRDYYNEELAFLSYDLVTLDSAPRGRIYDRNYNLLVDNQSIKTITYKSLEEVSIGEEIEMAYEISGVLELDYEKLSNRNLKEFHLDLLEDSGDSLISEEEWNLYNMRKLTDSNIYEMKLERISEDELSVYTLDDKKAAYLYYLMNNGYSYEVKVIKDSNVSDLEYGFIGENLDRFLGFDTDLSWDRVYLYDDTFRSILGNVNSIPYEDKDYYLKNGYSLNDRVGTSYLEFQYEDYLKGSKAVYQQVSQDELVLVSEELRGNDIVLSIDINLQKEIEDILEEELLITKGEPYTDYFNRAFVVISDPNSGEILAMAGKQIIYDGDNYTFVDYIPGVLTSPMTVGSVVKGASMLVAYNEGVIDFGEVIYDDCVKLAGVKEKCSWSKLGYINDIEALALSSNVYQFKAAIEIAGSSYSYNMPFSISNDAFNIYRNTFHEFGLGVKTEIDLPIESLGYNGNDEESGLLLDYVMGQYETYTPIQLSQYINTIANNGNRLQPTLLKEVRKSTSEDAISDVVIYNQESVLLNQVTTTSDNLDRVKEGFSAVMTSSYGLGKWHANVSYDFAGKTGTSQSFIDSDGDGVIDKETISTAFIGYAPSDNPKVSIVVTTPDSAMPDTFSIYNSKVNIRITKKVTDLYFDKYQ